MNARRVRRVLLLSAAGSLVLAVGTLVVGYVVVDVPLPADAAVREAFDETGLEVDLVRVIGVYGGPLFRLTYPNGDVCSYTAVVFEARVVGGSARPDGEETTETGWFTLAEAAGLAMAPHTRLLVAEAFRRDPAARFDAPGWRAGR